MSYIKFYANKDVSNVHPLDKRLLKINNPIALYEVLNRFGWCKETCAPRMQKDWSNDNPTLGQCSITAFLVQDIFGGDVCGVPLEDGNFHCFNVIDDVIFDLTCEQFKGKKLNYTLNYPQKREVHFKKKEKYLRYLLLKKKVFNAISANY